MYDVVRIDHFRGFDAYWEIPFTAETAKTGKWTKGPGLDFFKAIKKKLKSAKLIAEDLGDLTDGVRELRRNSGLPGMAILQFAFGGGADNYYLPHNIQSNTVLYPGTHDNDTGLGWYRSMDPTTQDHVRRYFEISGENIGWDMIRTSYKSVANLAIIPFQDILSLGSEGRFNTPGKAEGNWQWRYSPEQLNSLKGGTTQYLKKLAQLCYREGQPVANVI
jgi:4-alpha-glucanotransferase